MFAQVLVEIKAKQVDKTFTYRVPKSLRKDIQKGCRVLVPFGKKELEGFVLNLTEEENVEYEVKDILSVIDETPVLNEEMLELGRFMSTKTFSTLISCYQCMLPTALKAKKSKTVSKKYNTYVVLKKTLENPTPKQSMLLSILQEKKKILKKEAQDISLYAYKSLLEKGVIAEVKEETYRLEETRKQDKKVSLTEEQKVAVEEVTTHMNTFIPYLLFGVTGSGKTEVYMRILQKVLQEKKEAIVLIPEISLTPQFVATLKARFQNAIAILHSALTDGEKFDEWRKITRKEVSIVIGARSAIFAPLTNLGCIIVDEEHSSTYKQENHPLYHAIDIALYRAKRYSIPLVLGSATPSIETYTKAIMGKYHLLTLKSRINKHLPTVELIDMKEEIKKGNHLLSASLYDAILKRLEKKEQVILLLNRRGYSTTIRCNQCGYVEKCPNCDIPLTYHKTSNTERCHYCGYGRGKAKTCSSCGSIDLTNLGMGTQRLEENLKNMFKTARVVRMDLDTTSKKGAHQKIVDAFQNGEYDILIGTQMIAKGLDFPNVTLVGVLNGDAILNIPDFRSAERNYQLLSQVAGRSGRADKIGEVIIQAFNIEHYSMVCASHHDYESFYKNEMAIRSKLKYPPYCYLALIKIQSKEEEKADKISKQIRTYLESNAVHIFILGPTSATIPKINNTFYKQIIIKYKKMKDVDTVLQEIYEQYKLKNDVQVEIDFNPQRI